VLIFLFLFSGATSLVYEILWLRQLHLIFGVTQVAVSTVLAAFMAGLAIGGFTAARWADRFRSPLIVYAVLEIIIGLYAVVFPSILELLNTSIYLVFWRTIQPDPFVLSIFQFILLGTFILPPTFCMGATLPLLSRFVTSRRDEAGLKVGILYGANTVGAVIGTALAGFVLLPILGLSATTMLTAGANGVIGISAIVLSYFSKQELKQSGSSHLSPPDDSTNTLRPVLYLIAAIAGFSSLLYEVAWFRLMVLILGGSTYAFSIMLLAFLLGIGLGGWCGGLAADSSFRRGKHMHLMKNLALMQLGVAVFSFAAMWAYGELPFTFAWLYTKVEHSVLWLWPAKLLLAIAIMLVPALLMGATFPFLVQAAAEAPDRLNNAVGRLYGMNTLGAIFGAALGGLILLPIIEVRGTVIFAASINILAAFISIVSVIILLGYVNSRRFLIKWVMGIVLITSLLYFIRPPWNPLLMTSGMYQYVSDLDPEQRTREGIIDFAVLKHELLFYKEGLSAVVTVGKDRKGDNIWLAINGKVDASSHGDLETQALLAHLPLFFRPDSKKALIIGLASGITAGSVTLHGDMSSIDIIELEPSVVDASHKFDKYNYRPLDDHRVKLLINDARNHLLLTEDHTYDVVISEPSNPWLSGVSNLFTWEFFQLGKQKLKKGGVWSQWVHTYAMTPDDLKSLLATFADAYAYVLVFRVDSMDLVILGSEQPLDLDASINDELFNRSKRVTESLKTIGFKTPEDILSLYMFNRITLFEMAGAVMLNTDDNMFIEHSAPLHLHENTYDQNNEMLETFAEIPIRVVNEKEELVRLAKAYAYRDISWTRTLNLMDFVVSKNPDDQVVVDLYNTYKELAKKDD
jgi:spermidine synthase